MRNAVTVFKAGLNDLVTDFRPTRSTIYGRVSEPFPGAWQRNLSIEAASGLMGSSAVYACVTRIANDIAKLRPRLLELQPDGTMQPASDASPFWMTLRKPNHYQNIIQFVRSWLLSKLMDGNAYALKVRDNRGIVTSLYVLDPRKVLPLVTPTGDVYYSLGGDNLSRIPSGGVVPAREIIHDMGPAFWHPLKGQAPLIACALSGTLGLRIQQNSARFFENMSRPSGLITGPGVIDDVTAARLKAHFEENYSAGNIGRTAVMGDGLKYEPMSMPAEQSQLAEQLELSVADVARAFGMPLYKINAGQMPTNNNVEALNQQYLGDCLQTYIEDMEICWDEGIGTLTGQKVTFDTDGLLRMDSATRMHTVAEGVKGGILAPNEARYQLNYPPAKGGDTPYLQQQEFSLASLYERDQSKPFAKPDSAPAATPSTTADGKAGGQLEPKAIEAAAHEAIRKAFYGA